MKTILVDAWNTFLTDNGMNQEMKQMLDAFPNQKIILTNANPEEKMKFGIVDMPYQVFSLEHNPNKTDPIYFQKMLENFGLTVDNVIYFEHNSAAVESARSLGINTFWYDKDAKDLSELTQFIKNNI